MNKMKYGEKAIVKNELEAVPNPALKRRYTIELECPEFTCKCPRSGFPDFATIFISYVPDKYIVELKSLKLYINSFRDKYLFHEAVANIILDDLVKLIKPFAMSIKADFTRRGNIHTVIKAEYRKKK